MDKKLGFVNLDDILSFDSYFLSEQIKKRFLLRMGKAQNRTSLFVAFRVLLYSDSEICGYKYQHFICKKEKLALKDTIYAQIMKLKADNNY